MEPILTTAQLQAALAAAWDAGYDAGFDDGHWSRDITKPDASNPYRVDS